MSALLTSPDRPGDASVESPAPAAGETPLSVVQTATLFDRRPLRTEGGDELGPVTVAYQTHGTLNAAKDNAVFVCHALTGDAHLAGRLSPDDRKPGWWDGFVGPGALSPDTQSAADQQDAGPGLDTDRHFVICANVLGGCSGTTGPGSLRPGTDGPPSNRWGLEFPFVTLGDIVEVHAELVREVFGIERLKAVIGGSLGGMQALEWAVRFPDRVAASIAIASAASLGAQGIGFNAVGRRAILTDPHFRGGEYHAAVERGEPGPDAGLALARMLAHITYLSEANIARKFGRRLQRPSREPGAGPDGFQHDISKEVQFQIESYLDYQGRRFTQRFDANSLLYLTRAMDHFDLARGRGSLSEALGRATARFLILSYTTDWLFPTAGSRDVVRALLAAGGDVTFAELDSPYGHDAFLIEEELPRLGRIVNAFLG
ncbi:homoserine O-acetyltransferase MetX [Alienimonas chondri]|uniref:Homoserine O-acetyltransferase n=1 Tax=Alienimonas chondri TaxID=2681879 RepID=A0ABX1VG63_9PLAN|nr:homoserine O-acetyltransferase [Alienimonas chondri]NNJ25786.1 Homoserine O-acetyltransferase [Alienimonas chondri]